MGSYREQNVKTNNIKAVNKSTAIRRISKAMKLEAIAEYEEYYKIVNMKPLPIEVFEQLLDESMATIQIKTSILAADAAVVTELSK